MSAFTGIPTKYKGINFRSRLEATWAVFFDLLEWPWEYEPFDLEGWIPDFVLKGKFPVLIEVKPVLTHDEAIAVVMPDVVGAEPEYPVAVCGIGLPVADYTYDGRRCVGTLIYEPASKDTDWFWHFRDFEYVHCGWGTCIGVWQCGKCGTLGKDALCGSQVDIDGLWIDAKNRVQWKGQR